MTRRFYFTIALTFGVVGIASADMLCIKASGRSRVIKIRADGCRTTEVVIGSFDGSSLTLGIGLNVQGADMTVDGGNLRVQNGAGATDGVVNGTGNVIIGYNEGSTEDRSGSHNLVMGTYNAYSSAGGIVSGSTNRITAPGASVIASIDSTASGNHAVVLGGYSGFSTGLQTVVAGGLNNDASGPGATVVGGEFNEASVNLTTVAGGTRNRAAAFLSTAVGGACNAAGTAADPTCSTPTCVPGGCFETVTGGFRNSATGSYASVSGGMSRVAPGPHDWVAGGLFEDF